MAGIHPHEQEIRQEFEDLYDPGDFNEALDKVLDEMDRLPLIVNEEEIDEEDPQSW